MTETPEESDSGQCKNGTEKIVEVPEHELHGLYSTLADATEAAAAGNPDGCAELAAVAKRHVLELHEECNVQAGTDRSGGGQ